MKVRVRQAHLLESLRDHGEQSVQQLSDRFGVSEITVRRDLQALEEAGQVTRLRGGAALAGHIGFEPTLESRLTQSPVEKDAIGRAAAQLIAPGQSLAIDSGTTPAAMVRHLAGRGPLSIVTASIGIAQAFAYLNPDEFMVTMPGGTLRNASQLLVGREADLRQYHCDIAVISCTAFSMEFGVMHTNLLASDLKKTLVRIGQRVILVADHTKFGHPSLAPFAQLSDIDVIVTDWLTPPEVCSELEAAGIRVVVADDPTA